MAVSQDHLKLVSDSHSGYHVSYGALDGTNDCVSLLFLKPHLELQDFFAGFSGFIAGDFDGDMLEGFGESSQSSFDCHGPGFDGDLDSIRDL